MSTTEKRTCRQTYKNATVAEAIAHGCDLFQIKFDGIWARVELSHLGARIYSRNDKLKLSLPLPQPTPNITLVGEYMFGSERAQTSELKDKVILFDLTHFDGVDLFSEPYHKRYALLKDVLLNYLTERFELAGTYAVKHAKSAWELFQKKQEGLVFRNSKDIYDSVLYRAKYEVTEEFYAINFYEGEGRLEGTLGAIGVAHQPGGREVMTVGGGFSDEMRRKIWHNTNSFLYACLEVKGCGKFESGALRHPNFVKWRTDK